MLKRTSAVLMMAIAAVCFSGMALAQVEGTGQEQQQKAAQLQQQYQQKAAQLQQIHDETLNSHPELVEQQEEFVDMVREEIKNQGYDIEAGNERTQEMASKLQTEDLSEEERQSIMEDFQQERRKMGEARTAALEQPEIKAAGEQLQQDTLEAMKEDNPEVESLMEEMDELREEMSALMQQQQAPAGN